MKIRLIIIVLSFMSLMIVIANGFVYHHQLKHYVTREQHEDHERSIKITEDRINSKMDEYATIVRLLSGREEFLRALLDPSTVNIFQVNAVLDYYRDIVGAGVCYLLDGSGTTIASSNRHGSASFVGKNYAFRPYFKTAQKGKTAYYMAVGVTSGIRGVYCSHPVFHPAYGTVEGVVVVKSDPLWIQHLMLTSKYESVLLVDPNGFIFLSSRRNWQGKLLWQSSTDAIEKIYRSRQFGKGPFRWTGLSWKGSSRMEDSHGREYNVHDQALSKFPGWRLMMIHDIEDSLPTISKPMREIVLYILLPFIVLMILVSLLVTLLIRKEMRIREEFQDQYLFLQSLMEDIPDPLVIYNDRGEVRYLNQSFEEAFGWSLAELAGKRIDFVPETSQQETQKALARMAAGEKIRGFLARRLTRDGEVLDVEISASRFTNPSDGRQTSVVIFRDITWKRRSMAALMESEEKFRTIGNSAQDGIIMMDADGNISYWNPAAEKMFGITESEAIGSLLHQTIAPERYRSAFAKAFPQFQSSGNGTAVGQTLELTALHKDGTEFPVELSLSAVKSNERWQAIGLVRDITERKRIEAEEKLYTEKLEISVEERTWELRRSLQKTEEAKNRIDAINRSIAGGLIVTDDRSRVVMMNRESEEMLNIRFSKSQNLYLKNVIPIQQSISSENRFLETKQGETRFDFEVAGGDHGKPRTIRACISIIRNQRGINGGVVVTLTDVTWEREMERMKSEFISMAAHELRTPLTSILGFSEILKLRDDLPVVDKAKYLDHIHKKARSLSTIVDNITDIAKLESGKTIELDIRKVEVGKLVQSAVEKIQQKAGARRINVVFTFEDLELMADEKRMEQVLVNVLDNAVKFSPPAGNISIGVEQNAQECRFVIRDEGIGMTQTESNKVFDRFYRSDASHSAPEGTGLGMSMVKYLVEAHHGKVWVDSQSQKGTTITVSIPMGLKEEENAKNDKSFTPPVPSHSHIDRNGIDPAPLDRGR